MLQAQTKSLNPTDLGHLSSWSESHVCWVPHNFDYDAFGTLLGASGTQATSYLFTGEQGDADLIMYFLRARYFDLRTGRFSASDSLEGGAENPGSLHKYLYAVNNSTNAVDPSGNEPIFGGIAGIWRWIKLASMVGVGGANALSKYEHISGGPDITSTLNNTLNDIRSTFAGWSTGEKVAAIRRLHDVSDYYHSPGDFNFGFENAWDIWELAQIGLVPHPDYLKFGDHSYALTGGLVSYEGKVAFASQVNYAMWGAINKLAYDFASSSEGAGNGLWAWPFNLTSALTLTTGRKILFHGDIGETASEAKEYTIIGYNGSLPIRGLPFHTNGESLSERSFTWVWAGHVYPFSQGVH